MGNYRFKLSDMLPNAWFYKLNHTSSTNKTRKLQNLTPKSSNKKVQSKTKSSTAAAPQQTCHLRKSYHFNRDFKLTSLLSEPPRKSSNRTRSTKKTKAFRKLQVANSSVSSDYSSWHVSQGSICSKPSHMSELAQNYSTGRSSSCDDPVFYDLDSEFKRVKVDSPSNHYDYRIENSSSIGNHNYEKVENSDKFDLLSQLELKPILTKLDKADHGMKPATKFQGSSMKFQEESSCSIKNGVGEKHKCPVRKWRVNSGVKLRAKSPKIAPKRLTQVQGRGSVSSHSRLMSVAIVKESIDPDKDFKESMMEMIIEHNMSTKEEFEQLLACYLSLNPGTYHQLIAKVFEQVWFEITGN